MILTDTTATSLLRQVAKPVTNFGSSELKKFVTEMFIIMKEKNGAGLAAPQIGVSEQIFVYGFGFNPRYPDAPPVPETIVINPKILWQSEDTVDLEEGCLSVPNKRLMITRSKSITFTTMDLDGKLHEKTIHDFEARIVQHEMDHLNGVLILERAKA
jgi:peptide deformylase